ncbi:MAG: Flp pilus assembly protein CpaB [Actinomycetota bacterium]
MTSRTIVLAGAVAAIFGVVVVMAYARSAAGPLSDDSSVMAIVASSDIPAGTKASALERAVTSKSVPASLRPASAVKTLDELDGRMTVRAITKGEVLTAQDFGRENVAAPGAGLQIPPGFNAVTMSLPPPQGGGHYTQVGDLVNIFVTLRGQGQTITKLLLSNVQVLANRSAVVSESKTPGTGGEVMLTLALKPGQAEKVIFAKENGSLWFGLVHPGDEPAISGGGRTASNVLK